MNLREAPYHWGSDVSIQPGSKLITRFESDTGEQATGQNNHSDFLRVPEHLNHKTHRVVITYDDY